MGQAEFRGLLAFSAILALGSAPGWTKPALPDRPTRLEAPERVSGKHAKAEGPQAAEPANQEEENGPEAKDEGKQPVKPARQESEDEAPAREDKSDCDDCVIVRAEGSADPEGKSAGTAGTNALAGTLWGLFMVARPKRQPRTIIRGVTVP